jgi:hypothetical protein
MAIHAYFYLERNQRFLPFLYLIGSQPFENINKKANEISKTCQPFISKRLCIPSHHWRHKCCPSLKNNHLNFIYKWGAYSPLVSPKLMLWGIISLFSILGKYIILQNDSKASVLGYKFHTNK